MSCETLRERLAEDPNRPDEEFSRHAQNCAPCAAYRERLLHAEQLMQAALRFDVDALSRKRTESLPVLPRRSGWVSTLSGIAAGILIGMVLWAFWGDQDDLNAEELAAAVTAHWYAEREAWLVTDTPVTEAVFASVVDDAAQFDRATPPTITFAKTCFVAGELIPHLIVQGNQGPYMILLLPGRRLESPIPLELREEGLSGHIVPAGSGSIAVLGSGQAADLEEVESAVVSAVNWII